MSASGAEERWAGFWIRVLAQAIDSLLYAVVWLPAVFGAYGIEPYFRPGRPLVLGPVDIVFSYVLPAILVLGFWLACGATPGKLFFAARIVDATSGRKASPRQCIVRWIGYAVAVLPFGAGFFWVALDARKRGLHDHLAGTAVRRASVTPRR